MTIEKGDRVRVHADGEVIHVDPPGPAGAPRFSISFPRRMEDAHKAEGRERDRFRGDRATWFYDDEVETTLDESLVIGNGWRDTCADMIRESRDVEAMRLFGQKSGDASEYIKALEALYEHCDGSAPFDQPGAIEAFTKVRDMRASRKARKVTK